MQEPQSYEDDAGNVYVSEGGRFRVVRPGPPARPAVAASAAAPASGGMPGLIQMTTPSDARAERNEARQEERSAWERENAERRLALAEQAEMRAQEAAGLRGRPHQAQFDKARATRDATRYGEAIQGWTDSAGLEAQGQRAERLLADGAATGPMADIRIGAGRVAGDLLGWMPGVPTRGETQELEQLRLIGSQGALGDVGQLKGPLSEKELAFIQRLQIDPNASVQTNQQVAEAMQWAARRQAAYGRAMQRWVNDLGSPSAVSPQGLSFDAWWGQYAAQNLPPPGSPEAEMAASRRDAPAAAVMPAAGPGGGGGGLPGGSPDQPFNFVGASRDDTIAAIQRGGWFVNGDGQPYQLPPAAAEFGPERPGDERVSRDVVVRPREPISSDPEAQGEIERRAMEDGPDWLRPVRRAWRGIEAQALAASEQIPGLEEAAAWTAAQLSPGASYQDARTVHRDVAAYDRENYAAERAQGGVAGFAAMAAVPFGAPVRVFKGGQTVIRGGRAVPGLGMRARSAGNAALGMAGPGALYGFGQTEGNFFDRLGGGAVGAGAGAALGPVAQPAANAFGRFVLRPATDAAAGVVRPVARAVSNALGDFSPAMLQRAVAVDPLAGGMKVFARRSPQDPEAMALNLERMRAETIEPSFVDAVDDAGRGTLRSLATRQTPARQAARDFAETRAAELQDRISVQARRHISADPRQPQEIKDQAQAAAIEAATPFYNAAYQQSAEPTPLLDDLLRRPATRRALERARTLAANEGRQAEELRLVAMDDFSRPTGAGAAAPRRPADPQMAEDIAALNAGTRTRAGQGPTLMEFIARNGGIRDEWDEMATIGADRWSREAPWRTKLLQEGGVDLETMAQRAVDAGYFPDVAPAAWDDASNMSIVGRDALLEAMRREMAGAPRYAREVAPDAAERLARRGALEERLYAEGLNPRTATARDARDAFAGADDFEAMARAHLDGDPLPAPPVDIVNDTRPTMQTLDYVKRGLDDVLETYRDPVTGRLNLDDEGRTIEGIRRQFVKELGDMNPAYRAALNAYSGPIRQQFAADTGEDFMRMEANEFARRLEGMTPASRDAARAAARRGVERAAGTQGAAPEVARRLATGSEQVRRTEALIGDAAPLQQAMRQELRALTNAQDINPRAGSQTGLNVEDNANTAGGRIVAAARNPWGAAIDFAVDRLTTSRGFTNEEAEAVVMAATDPARADEVVALLADKMNARQARNLVRAVRHQLTTSPLSASRERQRR